MLGFSFYLDIYYRLDKYCWDGKHLQESSLNANYLKVEIDDYSKVVFSKDSQNLVDNFTVFTKNDRILVFGGLENSKTPFTNSLTYQWLVNEVRDYFGNKILMEYEKITKDNSFPYIKKVYIYKIL